MLLLDLQESPVQEMAELILEECGVDAVAVLDMEHHELRTAGHWPCDPKRLARGAWRWTERTRLLGYRSACCWFRMCRSVPCCCIAAGAA
jgi:hypothetical protein